MDRSNKQWILADLEKLKEQAANLIIKISAVDAAASTLIDDIELMQAVINQTVKDAFKEEEQNKMTAEFPVASLSREDLKPLFNMDDKEIEAIPDWTMKTIANLVGDDFMNKHFWKLLKDRATYVLNDLQKVQIYNQEDDGEID